MVSQVALVVKNPSAKVGDARDVGLIPDLRRSPDLGRSPDSRRKWQPAQIFLSGNFHRQRSLVGYSLWSSQESDTTEHKA